MINVDKQQYPKQRNLDGCYFRVQREGKWYSLCWTDLTEEERVKLAEGKDVYWLRRMLEYITVQFRNVGDHFDVVAGD